jgi:hypothetical protein
VPLSPFGSVVFCHFDATVVHMTKVSPQTRGWGRTAHRRRTTTAVGRASGSEHLIRNLLSRFPDVAENWVRAYISTLAFICEGGMVRRRTDTDEWPPVPPLNTARGAFRNGGNEIRLAIPVTIQRLRRLLGRTVRTPAAALAESFGLSQG